MNQQQATGTSAKYNAALDAAVRLLAYREHFKGELRRKLKQKGFGNAVVDRVLAECERLNYVDNRRCADLYARERLRKGYGIHRIRLDLKRKGLGETEIRAALSGINDAGDELETARRVLEKNRHRYRREPDGRKRREKIYRFLYARGFSPAVISELLRTGA